jgi:hypothetical protein
VIRAVVRANTDHWNKINFACRQERTWLLKRMLSGRGRELFLVVGRRYLSRQAAMLLKFAQCTSDPQVAAKLVDKAADLNDQFAARASLPDPSPEAPDVQKPSR